MRLLKIKLNRCRPGAEDARVPHAAVCSAHLDVLNNHPGFPPCGVGGNACLGCGEAHGGDAPSPEDTPPTGPALRPPAGPGPEG